MGILSNIKVIDLSRVLAGPWASQILGDMGAEIIKIEHPTLGDETRHWGPPYIGNKAQGMSAYFTATNRNKKSLALDISTKQGQDIIRKLIPTTDILLENFKKDGLKKYALDYESLRKIKSDLIYCSITGFGQTGPAAHRPGYDLMIQAMSGLMSITGEPNRPPVKVGVAVGDILTGLYSTIAMLSALWHRQATGKGQYIDMALFNVNLATLANQASNYLIGGFVPQPLGNAHPNIVPYQAFATKDGYILIAVGNDKQFKSLCEVLGLPEIAANPLYATNDSRVQNRTALIEILQEKLQAEPMQHWTAAFEKADIPCSPINDIQAAFNEPQATAQNMIDIVKHEKLGEIPTAANPIKFDEASIDCHEAPPTLGQHTAEILQSHLNMNDDEIKSLQDKKIIKLG